MNIKQDARDTGTEIWAIFLLLIIGGFGLFGAGLIYWGMFGFFAPKMEEVRRETFEQSRAFQEGTIRNLDKLCIEHESTDGAAKAAIEDAIRHQVSDIPRNLLPPCARAIKGY